MKEVRIALLPGDGIGPEVLASARTVLEAVAPRAELRLHFEEAAIGGAAIDEKGEPLPAATLQLCRTCDAALLGAVGGPRWSHLEGRVRPEQGLLSLRRELGLYANLRPVPVFPSLVGTAPVESSRLVGVDLLFVRELTGGIYFGPRSEEDEDGVATDTMRYTKAEVARVAHVAFRAARGRRLRVTSVDKANVLATSRLWRRTVDRVATDYPDVQLEHRLVDACAMQLIQCPAAFDVVLTGNLFGDILSDEAAVLSASLGLLPSASLGDGPFGLYEPVHGSAPELAGTGTANPIGAILSAALLLRHSLEQPEAARRVEVAVESALDGGARTADLTPPAREALTTEGMSAAILARL